MLKHVRTLSERKCNTNEHKIKKSFVVSKELLTFTNIALSLLQSFLTSQVK